VTKAMGRIASAGPGFEWLEPPTPNGTVTVADVLSGKSSPDDWARDVWRAWEPQPPARGGVAQPSVARGWALK
jgi:hypothetical protein